MSGVQQRTQSSSTLERVLCQSQRTWVMRYNICDILTGRGRFGSTPFCVNQLDLDERSQQVQRMADIYTLAQCVVVWLGSESEDSSWALRTLNRIGSMIHPDWSVWSMKPSDEATAAGELHWADRNASMLYESRELNPVHRLLQRAWFERLWIQQEIRLAINAVLVCGVESIPWFRFQNAVFYLYAKTRNNRHVVDEIAEFWDRLSMVWTLCDRSPQFSLWDQIERTKDCRCTDPRDRIYALLSISVRQEGVKITVDYRKSTEEIYQDVVLQHFKLRLNMLTNCEMQNPLSGRPSWVPDWAIRRLTYPLPLTGAAGNSVSKVKHIGENVLQVIGVMVAGIKTVECMTLEREVAEASAAVRRLAPPGLDLNSYQSIDIYCRTLLCDQFSDYFDPPIASYLKFGECHEALKSLLDMDGHSPLTGRRLDFVEFAIKNMSDRTFFWTEDGRMGLGPGLAVATDKIVVLPGCQSPMILRPSHNGNGRYRVVGECFIHDLMNGEALLGPLPDGYRRIRKLNRTDGLYYEAYQDNKTGDIQYEDPRFGLFKSEVRKDGVRRVYPTGFLRNRRDKDYIGLKAWTKGYGFEEEEVEVMRNDLQPFLLE